ncbi:MAG: DNA-binding transcriptional regulator Fis [Pseudohongiellaceae bacterium]
MKTDPLDTSSSVPQSNPELITEADQAPLRECVSRCLNTYFEQVENEPVSNLYDMVLAEVEAPLLEAVMKRARSNQTRASAMLGLNRGTLRKKLKQYDLI